jgi:hypothetical protein
MLGIDAVRCGRTNVRGPERGQTYRRVAAEIRPEGITVIDRRGTFILSGPVEHPTTKEWRVATPEGVWRVSWCGCAGTGGCTPL